MPDPTEPKPAVTQLISLGGAGGRGGVDRGPERRIVLVGLVGAAGFVAAAGVARLIGLGGGEWWLPLHLAMAGGAGLAIAALLPHFTVSLSGSRPAPAPARAVGLLLIGGGALSVAVAFPAGWGPVAVSGAVAYALGIVATAALAFFPARAGLGRRFGVVEVAYGLALANAAAAVTLAILRLTDVATLSGAWLGLKPAHAWLNLVGFVTLVVAATLIHLYPTIVGSRIRSRPALVVLVVGIGLGAPSTALGYALGSDVIARIGAVAVSAGAVAMVMVAVGAWEGRGNWTTDPAWHRLTIGHLSASVAWLAAGIGVLLVGVAADGADPAGWSLARVIGPLGSGMALQALVGAWSHLLPSVGPGDVARHAAQRRELARWATPRLVSWNVATALLTGGAFGPAWLTGAGLALLGMTLLVSVALLGRALVVREPAGGPAPA
ncbi:MAG: hypothetical protein H0W81_07470 [Chloroflexi bacterium]|nr:hypothetical protein [Chloroflexota bacterium]